MRRWAIPFLLCLASPAMLAAQDDVKQRTTIGTKGDIWVGQRVVLVVELLSPTFFAGSAVFDLPSLAGVTIAPPSERPVLGTETIGDINYTVQRHELSVVAYRAGKVTIPAFAVRFAIADGIGKPPLDWRLQTDLVTFDARMPPGAEQLSSLISTTELTIEESWSPETGTMKVGDAITHRVTLSAPDVPGMAFPPLPSMPVQDVGVYPRPPEVSDQSERGRLIGKRSQTVVYVAKAAGRAAIPGYELQWWDLDDKILRTATISGKVLDIAAPPVAVPVPRQKSRAMIWVVCGTVLAIAAWAGAHGLSNWRRRWRETEPAYFAALRRRCRQGDVREIHQSLLRWQYRAACPAFETIDDPVLRQQCQLLPRRVYGPVDNRADGWSAAVLLDRIGWLRHTLRRGKHQNATAVNELQPLNPVDSLTT